MTLIRVIPEILQTTSGKMAHVNGDLGNALADLSSVLNGIGNDYNGQLRNQVASKVGQAQGTASGPRNHINDLTLELDKRAKLFEAADGASSASMPAIGDAFADPRQGLVFDRWAWFFNLPWDRLWDYARLGLIFLPPAWWWLIFAPPNPNTGFVPPWFFRFPRFPFPIPRDWPPYLKYIARIRGPIFTTFPFPFVIPGIIATLPVFRTLPFPTRLPTFLGIRLPWESEPKIISPLPNPNESKSKQPVAPFPTHQEKPTTPSSQVAEEKSRVEIKDPGMNTPWEQIDAPNKNAPGERSSIAYRNVIDQFDVEHSYPGRYRPGDSTQDTRCNIFAGDVMRSMGVPLPTKGDLGHGAGRATTTDPMTANAKDLHNWLDTQQNGWRRIDLTNPNDLKLLLENLKAGRPAIASDPGHIAVLRPDSFPDSLTKQNLEDLHIAQAGANNKNDIALSDAGYGTAFIPDFYIHD